MKKPIILISAIFLAFTILPLSDVLSAKPIYMEEEYLNLYYEKYALETELSIIRDESKSDRDKLNDRISELKEEILSMTRKSNDLEVAKDSQIEKLQRLLGDLKDKSAEDKRLSDLRIQELEKRLDTLKNVSGSREKQILDDQKAAEAKFLNEISQLKKMLEDERQQSTREIAKLNDELLQWKQLNDIALKKLNEIEMQAKSMEDALKNEIQEGNLRIKRLKDRLVINIDDKILFDSGSSSLKPEVSKTLNTIADILLKYRDSRIIVEGHTDNVPIHNYRFRDNWQLSTERALSVLNQILQKAELNPQRFSVQGYGEYQPTAPNDSESNRVLNRRVDIVVLPQK